MSHQASRNPRIIRPVAVFVLVGAAAVLLVGCPQTNPAPAPFLITDAPSSDGPPVATPPASNPTASPARPAAVDLATLAAAAGRATPMVAVFDPVKQTIRLAGLRNDVVSFQVSFVGPAEGLTGLRLTMSDLEMAGPRGVGVRVPTLDRQSIELFRVLPIRVGRLPGWYQLYETSAQDRASGEFPDALVPADHVRFGQPWNVAPGEKLNVWADVPIPADAKPGVYEGQLVVATSNAAPRNVDVRIEVLPLSLPAEPAVRFLCPIDFKQLLACELGREELSDSYVYGVGEALASKRLAQWIGLGRAHGVQFLVADVCPIYNRDLAGRVAVDWSGYDRLIGPQLSDKTSPPVWLAPFRLDYPDASLYGGLAAAPYAELAEQYLRSVGKHFASKKWPQPLVWIHRDTPRLGTLPYGAMHWQDWLTDQRRQESLTIGRLVRLTELDVGYLETLPWTQRIIAGPSGPVPSGAAPAAAAGPGGAAGATHANTIPPHVKVYCPAAQFLEPGILPRLRNDAVSVWVGEGEPPWRPSTQVFARPEQLESLAYLARRYGLDTIWLGPMWHWPAQSALAATVDSSEASFLFYPGHWFSQDRPIASLRLKHLRQAAQAAAYMKLLTDSGRPTQADAVARAMVKYGLSQAGGATPGLGGPVGWVQEPAVYGDARMMLRNELAAAGATQVKPDTPAAAAAVAAAEAQLRFHWLQFNQRTAWIRLGLYPGQLVDQLDNFGSAQGLLRAVFRVNGFADQEAVGLSASGDELPAAGQATLAFGPLPATWQPSRFNVPLETQFDGPGQVVAVAADGRELPVDKSGRVALPVVLKSQTGGLIRLATDVPVLAAHLFRQAPQIDGRLDDWPVATWFRGSGFKRLAFEEPLSLFSHPSPQPTSTWIMAGHDDKTLYLAVVCQGQKTQEITPRYANNILFDRGLIVGEDAVEVVLDPTGGRLDRQGLYHLAIKATGAVVGWRGLAGPGGTGQPEGWGRAVRTEVNFNPDYWVIELAIPKSEFAAVNEQGLWRMNVIRHLAARGEHTAWASACPLVGEPESLGNLLLRPPPLPKAEVPLEPMSPLENGNLQ